MTKYKVNRGNKSERGDKVISLEAEWKLTGNKGKHIEGQRTETSGSARECNWVVGSQILTATYRISQKIVTQNKLSDIPCITLSFVFWVGLGLPLLRVLPFLPHALSSVHKSSGAGQGNRIYPTVLCMVVCRSAGGALPLGSGDDWG